MVDSDYKFLKKKITALLDKNKQLKAQVDGFINNNVIRHKSEEFSSPESVSKKRKLNQISNFTNNDETD